MAQSEPFMCINTLGKLCIESIYDFHINQGYDEDLYQEIVESIVGDMLMGKVKGKNIILERNVDNLIRDFYTLANKYYDMCHFVSGCDSYVLYRGTDRDYNPHGTFVVYPIPFSTSIDEGNTRDWVNKGDACCVWRIRVPLSTRLLALKNDPEGREVVLPAGVLMKTNFGETYDGIKIIDCDFMGTKSYEDMEELQKLYNYNVIRPRQLTWAERQKK